MSADFFAALIGRHVGTAPTVEPRIGARYEAAPAGGLPVFEQPAHPAFRSGAEVQPGPRPAADHAPASPVPPPRTGPAARRVMREPDAGSMAFQAGDRAAAFAGSDAGPPVVPARATPAQANETPDPHDRSLRLEALLAHLQALAQARGPHPSADRSAASANREQRANQERDRRAAGGVGATQTASPQQRAGESSRSGQPIPEPGRSIPAPAERDALAALQDRLSKHRGPADGGSMPIVNVTIGRVEVKAIREAAQAPARQKKAPAIMSLDDYLAQREQRS